MNSTKIFLCMATLAIGIALGGCLSEQQSESDDTHSVTPSSSRILGESELGELVQRANDGDTASAVRLWNHYAYVQSDPSDFSNFMHWLEIASNGRDYASMLTYASFLEEQGTIDSCKKAAHLLSKAKLSATSNVELDELEKRVEYLIHGTHGNGPCVDKLKKTR